MVLNVHRQKVIVINPFIPTVPYSGRITALLSVLVVCNFGILLTWTSEEGLSLFKEGVAENFPLLFFEETAVCKSERVSFAPAGCIVFVLSLFVYIIVGFHSL